MIVSALPPGSQALQVVPDLSKKVSSTLTEEGGGGGGGGGSVAPKPHRGRKKKRMLESGLPEMNDPYVLSPEDDDDHQKDGKTYRYESSWAGWGVRIPVSASLPYLCLAPNQAVCSASFSPQIHMHVRHFATGQEGRASSTSLVPFPPGWRPFGVISIVLFLSAMMEVFLVLRL